MVVGWRWWWWWWWWLPWGSWGLPPWACRLASGPRPGLVPCRRPVAGRPAPVARPSPWLGLPARLRPAPAASWGDLSRACRILAWGLGPRLPAPPWLASALWLAAHPVGSRAAVLCSCFFLSRLLQRECTLLGVGSPASRVGAWVSPRPGRTSPCLCCSIFVFALQLSSGPLCQLWGSLGVDFLFCY